MFYAVQLTDKLAAELTAANGADEALKVKREKLENQARLAQRGLEQLKSVS